MFQFTLVFHLKRFFQSTSNIELTINEVEELAHLPQTLLQKYVIKRKYNYFITLLLLIMELILYLYNFSDNVDQLEQYLTRESYQKFVALCMLQIIQIAGEVALVTQAIYSYKKYKLSSNYSLFYLMVKIVGSLAFLLIPMEPIIKLSDTNKKVSELAVITSVIYNLILTNLPCILLVQSFMLQSIKLSNIFERMREFRIIFTICYSIYIPIVVIVLGVASQFYQSVYLYAFLVFYIAYLTLNCLKIKSNKFTNPIVLIIWLAMLKKVCDDLGLNMWILFVKFIIRYIEMSEGVCDMIIRGLFYIMDSQLIDIRGLIANDENIEELQEINV
jgi:hypothetical protein